MDTALAAVIVAGVTLAFNILLHTFGGWGKFSGRLTKIESSVDEMKVEIKKLADVLIKMADMRGEIRVIDARMKAVEDDIRELRHGRGFVQDSIRGEYGR